MKPVTGKVTYQDETRSYESDICVDLYNYATFFSSTYDDPVVNELKNIKNEIKGTKNSVANLEVVIKNVTQSDKRINIRKVKYK